jgi:hypothetical protein
LQPLYTRGATEREPTLPDATMRRNAASKIVLEAIIIVITLTWAIGFTSSELDRYRDVVDRG